LGKTRFRRAGWWRRKAVSSIGLEVVITLIIGHSLIISIKVFLSHNPFIKIKNKTDYIH
jgi:hypothetical protein